MRGIFISDIHLHIWGNHNRGNKRIKLQLEFLETTLAKAFTFKCPIFFGGDLFHTPDGLSNELMSLVLPRLIELFNIYPVDFYAISGNHDLEGTNHLHRRSPSYINTLAASIKRFHIIDFESVEFKDFVVHGVPYITNNVDYGDIIKGIKLVPNKVNILMNHTDYAGEKDTNGIVIGKGENITEKDLLRFTFVMSGHVHKPTKLKQNIYSIGSPFEMRLSDMGGSFGYWTLSKKLQPKFRATNFPGFKYYDKESEIDGFHYWIKRPKDIVEEEIMEISPKDVGNRIVVTDLYLTSIHNRSREKKRLLMELIMEAHDD